MQKIRGNTVSSFPSDHYYFLLFCGSWWRPHLPIQSGGWDIISLLRQERATQSSKIMGLLTKAIQKKWSEITSPFPHWHCFLLLSSVGWSGVISGFSLRAETSMCFLCFASLPLPVFGRAALAAFPASLLGLRYQPWQEVHDNLIENIKS